jgi:hypothetical protein
MFAAAGVSVRSGAVAFRFLADDNRAPVGTARGKTASPMTCDDVIAEARDLMTPILGAATCGKSIARVFEIENVKDILELRLRLQAA